MAGFGTFEFSRRVFEGFEAPKRYKLLPLVICGILLKISWKMVQKRVRKWQLQVCPESGAGDTIPASGG